MRYYLTALFLVILCSGVKGNIHKEILRDSIIQILSRETIPIERMRELTDLCDLSDDVPRKEYAKELFKESVKNNNKFYSATALTLLLRYYTKYDMDDSTHYYLDQTVKHIDNPERDYIYYFFKTIRDAKIIYFGSIDEKKAIMREYQEMNSGNKDLTLPQRVGNYYFRGIDNAYHVNDQNYSEMRKKTAEMNLKIIEELKNEPLEYSYIFLQNAYAMVTSYEDDRAVRAIKAVEFLEMQKEYIGMMNAARRPYFSRRFLVVAYGELAVLGDFLDKEKTKEYFNNFLRLNATLGDDAAISADYDRYRICAEYYRNSKEYSKVTQYLDSLINYYRYEDVETDWNNMVNVIKEKIDFLEERGNYEGAFRAQEEYISILDSLRLKNMNIEIEDMKIHKELEEIRVQKKTLEVDLEKIRNQRLYFITFIFLALLGGIYVWLRMKRMDSFNQKLRKTNEEVKRAMEKAQESERLKNIFVKNMCHEVRTPLNAINGFASLIADEDLDVEEKKEYSRIIYENCCNVTNMMNDILGISTLENPTEPLFIEETSVSEIISDQIIEVKRQYHNPNLEYIMEGDPLADKITTNKVYFSHIIGNLLSNAAKFTQKGYIRINYSLSEKQNLMQISITDTGCGILPDKKDWIFEQFTKIDEFMPGSGLGLYYCRLIADHINAKIYLDTEYKEGARFVLLLPIV